MSITLVCAYAPPLFSDHVMSYYDFYALK